MYVCVCMCVLIAATAHSKNAIPFLPVSTPSSWRTRGAAGRNCSDKASSAMLSTVSATQAQVCLICCDCILQSYSKKSRVLNGFPRLLASPPRLNSHPAKTTTFSLATSQKCRRHCRPRLMNNYVQGDTCTLATAPLAESNKKVRVQMDTVTTRNM